MSRSSTRRPWITGVLIVAALGAGWALRGAGSPSPVEESAQGTATDNDSGADSLWTCSMHAQIQMPEAGDCPICGMDLVPVAVGSGGGLRDLSLTPEAKALLRIETAEVQRRAVEAQVRMVGKIAYDETRLADLSAWVPGRIDRMYVDYTGVQVQKGDHMVYMYSPKLVADQSALLQALDAVRALGPDREDAEAERTRATLQAARERLGHLGLTPEQVSAIEERGTPSDHLTIYAPMGGVVVHREGLTGRYVEEGSHIYTIADLSHLWVQLNAYESDLPWLHYGQDVEFTTEAWPGEIFHGTIAFIAPEIDARTRTAKVRVNLPNPDGRLKPEMFVSAVVRTRLASGGRAMDPDLAGKFICPMHPEIVADAPAACDLCGMDLVTTESLGYVSVDEALSELPLVIPATAPLVTGTRAVVYVEVPDADEPTYQGREILLGPRAGDAYLVRHGLEAGERVVTHGNFKLDSALQIQAKPSMMTPRARVEEVRVPPGARLELAAVEQALADLESARAASDLAAVHRASEALAQAVEAVDGARFGTDRPRWDELAMHLGNDAAEGRDLARLDLGQDLFAALAEDTARLRAVFGTTPPEPAPERVPVGADLAATLEGLWSGYLALHGALAGDSLEDARTAAGDLRRTLTEADAGELSEPGASIWTEATTRLDGALGALASAVDIEVARVAFEAASTALTRVEAHFGLGSGPIYQVECTMAFEDGARWLQADPDVLNPYFGDAMLYCGDVVQVLAQGAEEAASDG